MFYLASTFFYLNILFYFFLPKRFPALTFGGNGSPKKNFFFVIAPVFSHSKAERNENEMRTEEETFYVRFMSNACLYG